jgi:hypothetical protein
MASKLLNLNILNNFLFCLYFCFFIYKIGEELYLCRAPAAHACNPSHSEDRDQEDCDQGQLGQIVCETLSQK